MIKNEPLLLDIEQVSEIVNISRSTLYDMIKKGVFSKGLKVSKSRKVLWRRSDIIKWVENLPQV